MTNYFLIGLGGAFGALLRHFLHTIFNFFFYYSFVGTLVINLIGSFFLGLLINLLQNKIYSDDFLNYFLIIGVLGSFTTFSAFSYETIELILNKKTILAVIYILLSVFLSIFAAYIGLNFNRILN